MTSHPPPPTKYVVIAENETTSIYTVIIELEKNDKAQILEFTIDNVPFSIDNNKKEIKGSLPYGTDPTKLIATFKISQKASLEVNKIVQKSGQTINDFTNTVTYQVISENGKNKLYYKVIVKLEKNNEANILGFMIKSIVFSVNQGSKKIQGNLPYGTDITELIANFTISNGATIQVNGVTQQSGVTKNDFSIPLTYSVTSQDAKTKVDYTVTVKVKKNDEAKILELSLNGIDFNINENIKEINGKVYGLSDLKNIIVKFKVSAGAVVKVNGITQQSEVTANDFTNVVSYIVTSEDGNISNTYKVKLQLTNSESVITEFKFLKSKNTSNLYADIVGTIDQNKGEITLYIEGIGSNKFIASFIASSGAEVKANNIVQTSGTSKFNFTNTVDYKVTSNDGSQTKIYKVKVTYREYFKYKINNRLAIGGPIDVSPEKVFDGISGVRFEDVTTPQMPKVGLNNSSGRITGTVSLPLCANSYGIRASLGGRYLKCNFKATVWQLIGMGTAVSPFLIFTPEHLNTVRFFKKKGRHFKLMNDIDMSSSDKYKNNFRPIGIGDKINGKYYGTYFMGQLDGNGFKILNLKITQNSNFVGLFRSIGKTAIIKNLGIENALVQKF